MPEHARAGQPSGIDAKMNQLQDPEIIRELYQASQAGVPIRLNVRGLCCLRPRVPGLSATIRVVSVVGRFLEHARLFFFLNDGAEDVYLSSADWMDRNFFRRIELAFPVLDPTLKQRVIREGVQAYLDDVSQAWTMNSEGGYEAPASRRGKPRLVQEELLRTLAPVT